MSSRSRALGVAAAVSAVTLGVLLNAVRPRQTVDEPPNPATLTDDISAYRTRLEVAEQKAQDDYDKTLITLSGGALGLSFAFVKDILGSNPARTPVLLMMAWGCWGLSLAAVLYSFYASRAALRRAIAQVDSETIYDVKPGGWAATTTQVLNFMSGLLFIVGVFAMAVFIWQSVVTAP